MTLYEFIHQLMVSSGDKTGNKFPITTVLEYINEEVDYVSREFPEKASFKLDSTSAGYYHTIDFTGYPVLLVDNLMVGGIGADKARWKELKGRIGNAL